MCFLYICVCHRWLAFRLLFPVRPFERHLALLFWVKSHVSVCRLNQITVSSVCYKSEYVNKNRDAIYNVWLVSFTSEWHILMVLDTHTVWEMKSKITAPNLHFLVNITFSLYSRLQCPYCAFIAISPTSLKLHVNRHTGMSKFHNITMLYL